MFKLGEYPPSFFDKVFDLFIKYFDVDPTYKQKFIEDYTINCHNGNEAFSIFLSEPTANIEFCFYVIMDRYPLLEPYNHLFVRDKKVDDCNHEIKELADRCMNFKAFL